MKQGGVLPEDIVSAEQLSTYLLMNKT